ncbi:MAG: hypothetical protein R3F31_06830 [Verrucomicrobiales bacterium]
MLKAGYQLTCPLEKLELAGQTLYAVDGSSLFISVADRINKELIDAVAVKPPVQFICLDCALQRGDSLKVNTLEPSAPPNRRSSSAPSNLFNCHDHRRIPHQNFKALKDVHLKNLPPMAVFVGKNGTGKTTLFRDLCVSEGMSQQQCEGCPSARVACLVSKDVISRG